MKRQKMFVPIGVHHGSEPPNHLMMEPLCRELLKFENNKLEFDVMENGIKVTKKLNIRLLFVVADSPARAKLLHIKNFKGTFGCNICVIETKRPYEERPQQQVYPMVTDFTLRNTDEWKAIATKKDQKQAVTQDFGIKGTNPFMMLDYTKLERMAPQEFMHAMILGVDATLLLNSLSPSSLGSPPVRKLKLKVLKERMAKIKFPKNVLKEFPNEINANMKSFDLEIFLFYGIHTLKNIIPDNQYECLRTFSFLISKLCSPVILKSELRLLQNIAEKIVKQIDDEFSDKLHVSNFHAILHQVKSVEYFGPLTVTSAYQLENLIGTATRSIKNGTFVGEQCLNKLFSYASVNCFTWNTEIDKEFEDIFEDKPVFNNNRIFKPVFSSETPNVVDHITDGRFIFCCEASSTNRSTNDHFVKLVDNSFMKIVYIDENMMISGKEIVVEKVKFDDNLTFDYLYNGKINHQIVTFQVQDILLPFSAVQIQNQNDEYLVFELFNRHI